LQAVVEAPHLTLGGWASAGGNSEWKLSALTLLKRQAELESAIKQPGDICITEEQELHLVRQRLERFPEAMRAVLQAAHALRRPITEVSTDEVERWAATRAFR
jgi:hypothetical protein